MDPFRLDLVRINGTLSALAELCLTQSDLTMSDMLWQDLLSLSQTWPGLLASLGQSPDIDSLQRRPERPFDSHFFTFLYLGFGAGFGTRVLDVCLVRLWASWSKLRHGIVNRHLHSFWFIASCHGPWHF